MSIGDYWRASMFLMQRELKSWQEKAKPEQASMPEPMTRNTFCSTASRAFQATLKLASMCSDKSRQELQAAFNLSCSRGSEMDLELEEEEEINEGKVKHMFFYFNSGIFISVP